MIIYYTYKIIFSNGLIYIGSRQTTKEPECDPYMGSPKTFKRLWDDPSLTKEKIILKRYSTFEEMMEDERHMITESWKEIGLYGDGGLSLNAGRAGRAHPSLWDNPDYRQKMHEKFSKQRKNKPKSEVWKKSRSEKTKGILKPWIKPKPCIFRGKEYPSTLAAAKENGVHSRVVRKERLLVLS